MVQWPRRLETQRAPIVSGSVAARPGSCMYVWGLRGFSFKFRQRIRDPGRMEPGTGGIMKYNGLMGDRMTAAFPGQDEVYTDNKSDCFVTVVPWLL